MFYIKVLDVLHVRQIIVAKKKKLLIVIIQCNNSFNNTKKKSKIKMIVSKHKAES